MRSDRCDFRRNCPDYRIGNCDKCGTFRDELDEWLHPITRLTKAANDYLKGEKRMDFMDYVIRGKKTYLALDNGEVTPVQIDHVEMSTLEETRFEGHFITLRNSCTKPEIDMATFKEITQGYTNKRAQPSVKKFPGIKTVHFSGPCTVIIWDDKTKTIVRCKDENIDYEKGFAMAIAKKVFGTNESGSNYYDIFKKYLPEYQISDEEPSETETPKTESPTEVID